MGLRHTVPVLEAVRRLRGRLADPCMVSWPAASRPTARSATSTCTPSTSCRRSTSSSDRAARRSRDTPRRRSRARASRRRWRTPGRQVARRSSTRCWACGRSTTKGWPATTLHPPSRAGAVRGGRVGALPPRRGPRPVARPRRRAPGAWRELKGLWSYHAGRYKGLPLDDRTARESSPERPEPAGPRNRYVYYPAPPTCRSRRPNIRRRS